MTEPRTEAAAIPCPFCGGELYDSMVKFQLDDGRWFEGSFCPHCGRNLLRRQEVAEAVAAYRAELRAKVEGLTSACHSHSGLMCEPDEFGHCFLIDRAAVLALLGD